MAITQTFYVDPAQADGGDGSLATPTTASTWQ